MSDGSREPLEHGTRWLDALEWHTLLSEVSEEALTGARIRDWRRWYAEPQNQRVLAQLDQLVRDRQLYGERHRGLSAQLDANPYDPSISVREWRKSLDAGPIERAGGTRRRGWSVKTSAGALVAIAATMSAVVLLRPRWLGNVPGTTSAVVYHTGIGQLQTLRLSDGSAVTLGARTRLSIDFTARRRLVRLLHGEAWFRDRDIPNRPFIVTAGNGTIAALGTSFIVNRDADRVVVTVTAGTVAVSALPPAARRPSVSASRLLLHRPVVRVMRGEGLTYTDQGDLGPVIRTSAEAAMAWTQGRLIFDDVPLRYVVENVDRYWSRHISMSRRAGRLRFSGLIHENDIEDWLSGLSTILPVVIVETRTSVCIRMRGARIAQSNAASCQASH